LRTYFQVEQVAGGNAITKKNARHGKVKRAEIRRNDKGDGQR